MSNGHRWSKFWWQDWQNDPALRACSLAAQGLWMRILCLAHEGTPAGHLTIAGKAPTLKALAANVGATEKETAKLLGELEGESVFGRTADGTIYSRRMVKDVAASEAGREWGKEGGNPSLNGQGQPPKNAVGGLTPPLNPNPYPPPLSPPVSPLVNGGGYPLDTESESESEAGERKESKNLKILSLKEVVSPHAREELPSEAAVRSARRAFAAEISKLPDELGSVIRGLGGKLDHVEYAPGRSPTRDREEQADAVRPKPRPKAAYLSREQLAITRQQPTVALRLVA